MLALAGCGDPLTLPSYFGDPRIVLHLAPEGLGALDADEILEFQLGGLDETGRRIGGTYASALATATATVALYFPPLPTIAAGGLIYSDEQPRPLCLLRIWLEAWRFQPESGAVGHADRRLFGIAPKHLLLFVPSHEARRELAERDPRGISGTLVEGYNLLELTCHPERPADALTVVGDEAIPILPPESPAPCLRLELPTSSNDDIAGSLTPVPAIPAG